MRFAKNVYAQREAAQIKRTAETAMRRFREPLWL